MGLTTIPVTVTDLSGKKRVSSNFLVDTGASYTVLPAKFVKKLA